MLVPVKNKHSVIESRAAHVIASAINLIELIHSNYDPAVAEDLTKRLAKSILLKEATKFTRRFKQIQNKDLKDGE